MNSKLIKFLEFSIRLGVFLGVMAALVFALYPADAFIPRADGALAHFGAFLVLSTMCMIAWPHVRWVIVGLVLLGLGATIELVQYAMAAGRTADLLDLAFDAVAIGTGLIMGTLIRKFFSAFPSPSR